MADVCISTPQPRSRPAEQQSARKRRAPSRLAPSTDDESCPKRFKSDHADVKHGNHSSVTFAKHSSVTFAVDTGQYILPSQVSAMMSTPPRNASCRSLTPTSHTPKRHHAATDAATDEATNAAPNDGTPKQSSSPSVTQRHARKPLRKSEKHSPTISPTPRDRTPDRQASHGRPSSPHTPPAPRRHRGRKSLVHAISAGNRRLVVEALQADEDVNSPYLFVNQLKGCREKMLPIFAAAQFINPSVVQALLEGGAVANSVNSEGQTPLHLLAQNVSSDKSQVAEKVAAVPSLTSTATPSRTGQRATERATVPRNWKDLSNFLDALVPNVEAPELTHAADVSDIVELHTPRMKKSKQVPGAPRLSISSPELHSDGFQESDLLECVSLLIQNGADADKKDNKGRTALDYAKLQGHSRIAALLQAQSSRSRNSKHALLCTPPQSSSPESPQQSGFCPPKWQRRLKRSKEK